MTFDHFLYALRVCGMEHRTTHTPTDDVYAVVYSVCPVCRTEGCLTLEVVEYERLRYRPIEMDCLMGCGEFRIRQALARDMHLSLAAELEAA